MFSRKKQHVFKLDKAYAKNDFITEIAVLNVSVSNLNKFRISL